MVCRKALSFTNELSFLFFIFCQYATLSSRAVDGHQMYSGGSVVRKTSTIDPEISLSPPLVFTGGEGGSKVRNLASFSTSLANRSTLSHARLKMQQDIRTLKQISCVAMIALCPRQVW